MTAKLLHVDTASLTITVKAEIKMNIYFLTRGMKNALKIPAGTPLNSVLKIDGVANSAWFYFSADGDEGIILKMCRQLIKRELYIAPTYQCTSPSEGTKVYAITIVVNGIISTVVYIDTKVETIYEMRFGTSAVRLVKTNEVSMFEIPEVSDISLKASDEDVLALEGKMCEKYTSFMKTGKIINPPGAPSTFTGFYGFIDKFTVCIIAGWTGDETIFANNVQLKKFEVKQVPVAEGDQINISTSYTPSLKTYFSAELLGDCVPVDEYGVDFRQGTYKNLPYVWRQSPTYKKVFKYRGTVRHKKCVLESDDGESIDITYLEMPSIIEHINNGSLTILMKKSTFSTSDGQISVVTQRQGFSFGQSDGELCLSDSSESENETE
jgi:hypothetical protein